MASNEDTDPIVTGVEAAFLRMRGTLRRIVGRLVKNPDETEDILQEAFVQAVSSERNRPIDSPEGYLVTVARNLAFRELRTRSARMMVALEEAGASELIQDEVSGDDRVIAKQRLSAFIDAARSLPPQARRAFLLCKVKGLSYKDAAREMGISVSTLEKHLILALQRCGSHLRAFDEAADAQSPSSDPAPSAAATSADRKP